MKQKGLWSPAAGGVPSGRHSNAVPAERDVDRQAPCGDGIALGSGRSLHFDSDMDAVALTRLIRAVEAA